MWQLRTNFTGYRSQYSSSVEAAHPSSRTRNSAGPIAHGVTPSSHPGHTKTWRTWTPMQSSVATICGTIRLPEAIAPIATPMRSGAGHHLARTTRTDSGIRRPAGQRAWNRKIHQHCTRRSALVPPPPSSPLDATGVSTVNDADTLVLAHRTWLLRRQGPRRTPHAQTPRVTDSHARQP